MSDGPARQEYDGPIYDDDGMLIHPYLLELEYGSSYYWLMPGFGKYPHLSLARIDDFHALTYTVSTS